MPLLSEIFSCETYSKKKYPIAATDSAARNEKSVELGGRERWNKEGFERTWWIAQPVFLSVPLIMKYDAPVLSAKTQTACVSLGQICLPVSWNELGYSSRQSSGLRRGLEWSNADTLHGSRFDFSSEGQRGGGAASFFRNYGANSPVLIWV